MKRRSVGGVAFDFYGTLVDVAAVAEACGRVVADPRGFCSAWRQKQLEYTFLRTCMGRHRDFWAVTSEALDWTLSAFDAVPTPRARKRLMEAWLRPRPFPETASLLGALKPRLPLAVLSNGSPRMLRLGLASSGLRAYFSRVLSVESVGRYKPSPEVYRLAPERMGVPRGRILFVSANPFDVMGATSYGFRVCWVNRDKTRLDPLGFRPDFVVESLSELPGLGVLPKA